MGEHLSVRCYEGRLDCFALDPTTGKCRALNDTSFKKDCPFYKPRRKMLEENPVYYSTYGKKVLK